jgi:hypothetical protein
MDKEFVANIALQTVRDRDKADGKIRANIGQVQILTFNGL